jgi:hypothetical protein
MKTRVNVSSASRLMIARAPAQRAASLLIDHVRGSRASGEALVPASMTAA